jgi:uncharacterized membrane protein YkvI
MQHHLENISNLFSILVTINASQKQQKKTTKASYKGSLFGSAMYT